MMEMMKIKTIMNRINNNNKMINRTKKKIKIMKGRRRNSNKKTKWKSHNKKRKNKIRRLKKVNQNNQW